MEYGSVVGYARIVPSEKLKNLMILPHPSLLLAPEIGPKILEDDSRAFLGEIFQANLLGYEDLRKELNSLKLPQTPEKLITMNAKNLLGTFEVHEILPSQHLEIIGENGKELDNLQKRLAKGTGLSGMSYCMHKIPTSNYIPSLATVNGELDIDWGNIYSICLRNMGPYAIITRGTLGMPKDTALHYGSDIFPTNP
jgi:hypothetical protein